MKIWTNNKFTGYWPIGTAAVVVADSANSAATYLNCFLAEKGLDDCNEDQFEEMVIEDGNVVILNDGEY